MCKIAYQSFHEFIKFHITVTVGITFPPHSMKQKKSIILRDGAIKRERKVFHTPVNPNGTRGLGLSLQGLNESEGLCL